MTSPASKRVLVTRPEKEGGPLSTALRRAGLEPILVPAFEYVRPDSPPNPSEWSQYTWAAWTSAAAVEAVLPGDSAPPPSRLPPTLHHAAVGAATAAALGARGIGTEIVGEGGSAALAELLIGRLGPDDRLVYPKSGQAGAGFAGRLRSAGLHVDDPVAYRLGPADPACIRAALALGPAAVTFASPSAVEGFADALDHTQPGKESSDNDRCGALRGMVIASIGPTTSAALRDRLREPDAVAVSPSFEDLAAAVASAVSKKRVDLRAREGM